MRQRLTEAAMCCDRTEGSRKKGRNTAILRAEERRGEREKRQAWTNPSIEKGEQLLPQTPIHTPTSLPRNPQIPSYLPFSPPSPDLKGYQLTH